MRLGERLVAEGTLTEAAVHRALGYQGTTAPRVRLGSILLTWDLIDESRLLAALAALHRCEAVTGEQLAAAPVDVVRLLEASHAIRLAAIPYALDRSRIRVAFVDPSDVRAVDEVAALTGHACLPGIATELRLLQAHRRFYGRTLPAELKPIPIRVEPGRPSRTAEAAPKPVASGNAAPGIPPITIPDLPVPPRPSGWRVTPAAPPPLSDREIGDIALSNVPPEFARAILFASDGGALVGWRARGIDASRGRIEELRVSATEPSVLSGVLQTGTPHFGRVDEPLWPAALARILDGPPPCAIFPVHSAGAVAALLYADRRGAPMRFEDTGLLARAAAKIAALIAEEPPSEGH